MLSSYGIYYMLRSRGRQHRDTYPWAKSTRQAEKKKKSQKRQTEEEKEEGEGKQTKEGPNIINTEFDRFGYTSYLSDRLERAVQCDDSQH